MKTTMIVVLSVIVMASTAGLAHAATAAPAADKLQIPPPSDYKNLRPGLWEMTDETMTEGGPKIDMAKAQAHMAEDMKNLPPEQRARVEALMKKQAAQANGAPTTRSRTHQKCMTAAKRDKDFAKGLAGREDGAFQCKMKESSRTSSKVVVDISCTGRDKGQLAKAEGRDEGPTVMSQSGTMTFELKSPTEMETRMTTNVMMGNEPMKSDMKMHARWLSADCGKVKPDEDD